MKKFDESIQQIKYSKGFLNYLMISIFRTFNEPPYQWNAALTATWGEVWKSIIVGKIMCMTKAIAFVRLSVVVVMASFLFFIWDRVLTQRTINLWGMKTPTNQTDDKHEAKNGKKM